MSSKYFCIIFRLVMEMETNLRSNRNILIIQAVVCCKPFKAFHICCSWVLWFWYWWEVQSILCFYFNAKFTFFFVWVNGNVNLLWFYQFLQIAMLHFLLINKNQHIVQLFDKLDKFIKIIKQSLQFISVAKFKISTNNNFSLVI